MAKITNNGWSKDPSVVRLFIGNDADGVEVATGDVATLFTDFLSRYHNEVEPLRKCNGYRSSAYNASLPGSVASSNHVSGTAVDNNGDVHPNELAQGGKLLASGFGVTGEKKLRTLLAQFPVIKWGGDFPKRARDYMHFEICVSAAALREFCKRYDAPPPPPPPVIDNSEDMDMLAFGKLNSDPTVFVGDGITRRPLTKTEYDSLMFVINRGTLKSTKEVIGFNDLESLQGALGTLAN